MSNRCPDLWVLNIALFWAVQRVKQVIEWTYLPFSCRKWHGFNTAGRQQLAKQIPLGFFWVFFPKADVGQEHLQGGCCGFPGESRVLWLLCWLGPTWIGAALVWPWAVWCRLGMRLSHPSCAGLVTPAGMSLIFWKIYHEVTSGDSCVGRCSANLIVILPWHAWAPSEATLSRLTSKNTFPVLQYKSTLMTTALCMLSFSLDWAWLLLN